MTTRSSAACCSRPVAVTSGYTAKGPYRTIGGTKCYVSGPHDATKAVYYMYDIFGYTDQTIQGADILASGGKEPYLVIIPDLLEGKPAEPAWMGRDTEEKKEQFAQFMTRIQDPAPHIECIYSVLDAAKKEYSGVEKWAAIGYCWGGKLVSLTSGANSPWTVAVETSPARVTAEDAKKITIPLAMLASKDEKADDVKAFGEALTAAKHIETFGDQVHGWMSARADLSDEKVKSEYERGYQVTLDFLAKHLGA